MNRTILEKIRAEKQKIARRLDQALGGMEPRSDEPEFSTRHVHYEMAERTRAIGVGGLGAIHQMVRGLGLVERLDAKVNLLKRHRPYHESDHVLNIAYNAICGGQTLDDIELRRNDRVFLDVLGARAIPDPTTAGDFCRRFEPELDRAPSKVWDRSQTHINVPRGRVRRRLSLQRRVK